MKQTDCCIQVHKQIVASKFMNKCLPVKKLTQITQNYTYPEDLSTIL